MMKSLAGMAILAAVAAASDELRVNQLQALGSRNSYHLAPPDKAMEFLYDLDRLMGDDRANVSIDINYSHLPISDQLSKQYVRHLDFDMFWDPQGGLYVDPMGLHMPDITGLANFAVGVNQFFDDVANFFTGKPINRKRRDGPWDSTAMNEAGYKVLNVPDFDFNSNCQTLKQCLGQIQAWSQANPKHLPLTIRLNPKDVDLNLKLKGRLTTPLYNFLTDLKLLRIAEPPLIGQPELLALEGEVLSVFKRGDIITPDDVRGSKATVRDAIGNGEGWPTVKNSLGKVMFTLTAPHRAAYLEGAPNLENRLFFTAVNDTEPDWEAMKDVAFVTVLTPAKTEIRSLVDKGYLVQAFVDHALANNTAEPLANVNDVIGAGTHFIMTEFPGPQAKDQNVNAKPYEVSMMPQCNVATYSGKCQIRNGEWVETVAVPPAAAPAADASASSTTSPPAANTETEKSSSNTGLIVGIAVGVSLLILLLLLLAFCCYRRRQQQKQVVKVVPAKTHDTEGCQYCSSGSCPYAAESRPVLPPPYQAAARSTGAKGSLSKASIADTDTDSGVQVVEMGPLDKTPNSPSKKPAASA